MHITTPIYRQVCLKLKTLTEERFGLNHGDYEFTTRDLTLSGKVTNRLGSCGITTYSDTLGSKETGDLRYTVGVRADKAELVLAAKAPTQATQL